MTDRTVSSPPPRSRAASTTTSPERAGRRRFRRRDEKGAALVEFALVFVVFIFLLYGLITFGVILAQKHAITNAAADGARSAVGATTDPAAQTLAESRIVQALGAPNGRYSSTFSFAPCGGNAQVHHGAGHLGLQEPPDRASRTQPRLVHAGLLRCQGRRPVHVATPQR